MGRSSIDLSVWTEFVLQSDIRRLSIAPIQSIQSIQTRTRNPHLSDPQSDFAQLALLFLQTIISRRHDALDEVSGLTRPLQGNEGLCIYLGEYVRTISLAYKASPIFLRALWTCALPESNTTLTTRSSIHPSKLTFAD